MPQPRTRQLRDARGPVAASVATAGALLAHLIGGGSFPGLLGIIVPLALSLTVCTVVAGRRLTLWRTTVSVVVSQLLFHLLFVLGAPGALGGLGGAFAGGGAGATGHPAGRGTHGAHPVPPASTSPHVPDLIGADATMWCWHAVAAAVTVVALYSGERALVRLQEIAGQAAAWLRRRLLVPADPATVYPLVRVITPDWFTGSVPARPEVSSSRRRGPPRAYALRAI